MVGVLISWQVRKNPKGGCPDLVISAVEAIATRLILLSPGEGVAVLKAAGFDGAELFHAGFTFNGWVGYRAP